MLAPLRRTSVLGVAALTTAAALVLGGCSDSGDSADGNASADSSSPLPTPSTSVDVPEDTSITAPGTKLGFGETATVAYEVKNEGTVLALTVNSAEQGSLKDFAGFNLEDKYQRQANYYYVRVNVKNAGKDTFGGVDVPLWGISGNNTLLPPVRFTSAFAQCPTEPLPKKFAPGDKFTTCLVFLSPNKGKLAGVSYRPTEDYVPIEWHGKVVQPKSEKGKSGKGDKAKKGDKKQQ
jgi:hypothetical protein